MRNTRGGGRERRLRTTDCQQHGGIGRNMGDALAFCPPLIIKEDQVDDRVERVGSALDELRM